jgi:hypothetical protein
MWRLVLGAILSLLPRRWRDQLPLDAGFPWERAAMLSGLVESMAALLGLVTWYSHSVTTWAANALDSALRGGPEANVPGQAIGFSALVLWVIHPLTWCIGFFAFEGIVRFLAAAFTEQVFATLPLAAADWCYGKIVGRPREGDAAFTPGAKEQLRSLVTAVREGVRVGNTPEMVDELVESNRGEQTYLEIRSSHPKPEWVPPKVVRIAEQYYRLEELAKGKAPRTFVFRLRRLTAGVPGRTVIVYDLPGTANDQSRLND